MSRKIVNYTTILKRSRCLNSAVTESTKVDSNKIFNNLNRSIEIKKNGRNADTQQLLRSFIESLCNTQNASSNYYQIFNLLETFNTVDPVISDRILAEYVDRILPYTENIEAVVNSLERRENLTEDQKNTIFENCTAIAASDRFLKNHESISKRFNIERECNRIRSAGLKYFIDSCADMIDTYRIKEYQKMNLLFEECYYLLEKNHVDYNKENLLKGIVEFYLIQNPYISEHELNNFRRAVNENYILEEEDIAKVQVMLASDENPTAPYKSINDAIHRYLVNCNKSDNSLPVMINRVMNDTNKQDILANIENLIYLLWGFVKNKTFESDEGVFKAFGIIPNYISGCTKLVANNGAENVEDYSKEDLVLIINKMDNIKTELELVGNSNPAYSSAALSFIKNALNPAIDSLSYTKDILYSRNNLDSIKFVNTSTGEGLPLNEYKIFKFHNLVNAAFNLNKFLKVKEKKFINSAKNKIKNFVSRTKNILFGEMAEYKENIYSYIGEDCKASICVRQYPYTESELNELSQFLDTVCNEYNDLLISQNMDTMRAYYTINPGIAEINIKETTEIELTESEMNEVRNNFDSSIDLYLETFVETSGQFNTYDGFMMAPIEEQILDFSKFDNFTYEHFTLALEAMSYLNLDSDIVKVFGDKFSDYQFNKAIEEGVINESYVMLSKQEKKVSEAVENWTREEEVPSNIQLEAYGYLLDIIEEASSKPPTAVGGKALEDRLRQKGYYNGEDDEDEEDPEDEDSVDETEDNDESTDIKSDVSKEKESNQQNDSQQKERKRPIINLNNIKLGLMGLRQKFKDMSNKEKEMSRNLDNSVRSVVTSMKRALVSDRREAIIKGSLIPSFSRCIKAGLGLTILGVLTNGVTIPIIVAMGGLAVSKKLNDRERLLILDEIETELEVVEKEMSMADSNNQIKKYRALIQYKKELQRQYQRIRYNLRTGKRVLPADIGVGKNDDK